MRPSANPPHAPNDTPADSASTRKDLGGILFNRADDIETQVTTAAENGLFSHQSKVALAQILEPLAEAFQISLQKEIAPEDYSIAIIALDNAQNLFDTALESIGRLRRLTYVYGVPSLAYLIGILALILLLALKPPSYLSSSPAFLTVPKKILLAGAVGGILRGIIALWNQVDEVTYRKFWDVWFFLSPFVGALLGAVVYLAFFIGIVVSTLSTSIPNPSLAIFIAILAGYNWQWARDVLAKAVQVFNVGQNSDKGT